MHLGRRIWPINGPDLIGESQIANRRWQVKGIGEDHTGYATVISGVNEDRRSSMQIDGPCGIAASRWQTTMGHSPNGPGL